MGVSLKTKKTPKKLKAKTRIMIMNLPPHKYLMLLFSLVYCEKLETYDFNKFEHFHLETNLVFKFKKSVLFFVVNGCVVHTSMLLSKLRK